MFNVNLVIHYGVDPELRVPVRVRGPARGDEGRVGGFTLLVVVDDEPVVVRVAVELRRDSPLEPVDDLAVLPPPARQTAAKGVMAQDVDSLTST